MPKKIIRFFICLLVAAITVAGAIALVTGGKVAMEDRSWKKVGIHLHSTTLDGVDCHVISTRPDYRELTTQFSDLVLVRNNGLSFPPGTLVCHGVSVYYRQGKPAGCAFALSVGEEAWNQVFLTHRPCIMQIEIEGG